MDQAAGYHAPNRERISGRGRAFPQHEAIRKQYGSDVSGSNRKAR
jgi:hypothetical protein